MKITENSANESELAVQFKTLAIEIFKTLSLPEELREGLGIDYLNKVYTRYIHFAAKCARAHKTFANGSKHHRSCLAHASKFLLLYENPSPKNISQ